jgi:hypothetical protein
MFPECSLQETKKSKKDKKKDKKKGGEEEEDLDAILNELGIEPKVDKEAEEAGGKELSESQKKKLKKKAKEAAVKAGEWCMRIGRTCGKENDRRYISWHFQSRGSFIEQRRRP